MGTEPQRPHSTVPGAPPTEAWACSARAETGKSSLGLVAQADLVPVARMTRGIVAALGDVFSGPSADREPTDCITDRERVRRLLEEADGTLPQTEIVDATGWSKMKVSRLLSEMAADNEVVKIRLGRENLVCLPDCTPTAIGG